MGNSFQALLDEFNTKRVNVTTDPINTRIDILERAMQAMLELLRNDEAGNWREQDPSPTDPIELDK
jgi:hypothetical protein